MAHVVARVYINNTTMIAWYYVCVNTLIRMYGCTLPHSTQSVLTVKHVHGIMYLRDLAYKRTIHLTTMNHTDVRTFQYRSGSLEFYQRQLDAIVAELPTTHDTLQAQVPERASYDLDQSGDVLHTDAYMIRMYRPLEKTRFTDTSFGEVVNDLVVLKNALVAFVSRHLHIVAERVRDTLERSMHGEATRDLTPAFRPTETVQLTNTFTPIRITIIDHGNGVTDLSRRIRSASRSTCEIVSSHAHGMANDGYRSRFSMLLEACSITLDWIIGNAETERDRRPAHLRDVMNNARNRHTADRAVRSFKFGEATNVTPLTV